MRNLGKNGPKVTGPTDIRNALRVPLPAIIPTDRRILLRQIKPRSPTESLPWWFASCNKFACAKHSSVYWGPVRKILPDWIPSAVRKRLPTLALQDLNTFVIQVAFFMRRKCLISLSTNQSCRARTRSSSPSNFGWLEPEPEILNGGVGNLSSRSTA